MKYFVGHFLFRVVWLLEVLLGVTYLRAMEQQVPVAFKRLIWIGHAEGISYLLLLGIAMPLKYMWGFPEAVKITGSLHGILFVLFVFALINAKMDVKLSTGKIVLGFLASIVPFGTFFLARIMGLSQK